MNLIANFTSLTQTTFGGMSKLGEWIAPLGLRLLLAYEFWQAGVEKFNGENWFADIQDEFPFPFNIVPPEISWQLSTWGLGRWFFAENFS